MTLEARIREWYRTHVVWIITGEREAETQRHKAKDIDMLIRFAHDFGVKDEDTPA